MKTALVKKIVIGTGLACMAWQLAPLTVLDGVLLAYIAAAFAFAWSGLFVLGLGVALELLVLLAQYQVRHELNLLESYPAWIIVSGVMLLVAPWITEKSARAKQNHRAGMSTADNIRDIITSISFLKVYHQWFGGFSYWFRARMILLGALITALFLATTLGVDSIALIVFFSAILLFTRDSRIASSAAFLSFVGAAFLATIHFSDYANTLIMYGYYFACMIIVLEIKQGAIAAYLSYRLRKSL